MKCEDAKTQLDLNLCALREVEQGGRRNRATYDELKKLDSAELAKFEAAARVARYRDALTLQGRSRIVGRQLDQGFMESGCRARLTRHHRQELKS